MTITNCNEDDDDGGALTAVAITRDSVLTEGEPPLVSSFFDEPKDRTDAVLGDVTFVADDGEGNTSVLKPRKPNGHSLGVNYNKLKKTAKVAVGDNNGDDDHDHDDDDDSDYSNDDTLTQYNHSKWHIVSAVLFVVSSLLYVGMACMIMDKYWHYKDVPRDVYWADDDATWWNYFVNCTDDEFFPEEVWNATDDVTWYEWYDETAFPEDDSVWLPKIADEDAPGREPYVSKYMILYFIASLGYLLTGIIEVVLARKYFWYMMLYILMIVSALFGMSSAILNNKNPEWANISSFISVHLWSVVALVILIQRLRGQNDADDYDKYEAILGFPIRTWFLVADASFVFGTLGDLILSYFYIAKYDNYKMGISSIVFAMGWLICAFVYLAISIYDHVQYRKYFLYMQDEEGFGQRELLPDITLTISNNNNTNTINNNNNNTANSSMLGMDSEKPGTMNTEIPSENSSSVDASPPESSINDGNEENNDEQPDIITNFFPDGQPPPANENSENS